MNNKVAIGDELTQHAIYQLLIKAKLPEVEPKK